MALRKDTTLSNRGVNLPNGYHRITNVKIDFDRTRTQIEVTTYADEATRTSGGTYVDRQRYDKPETLPIIGMGNPQQYAYNYLKTLPEFSGAVDV